MAKNSKFGKNAQQFLEDKGRLIRCDLGRPELDYICNLAHKSSRGELLCGALVGWSKRLEVEGLERCFLTARNEYKLKISNKRNRGLKSG